MNPREELTTRQEDYLTVMYSLFLRYGVIRSTDTKKELGVSGSSVTEACRKLQEKKLIQYAPYKPIILTEEGMRVARDLSHKKETLRAFFIEVLGVDKETAGEGACKMEHIVSREIIERMIKYSDFLRNKKQKRSEHIREYLDNTFSGK